MSRGNLIGCVNCLYSSLLASKWLKWSIYKTKYHNQNDYDQLTLFDRSSFDWDTVVTKCWSRLIRLYWWCNIWYLLCHFGLSLYWIYSIVLTLRWYKPTWYKSLRNFALINLNLSFMVGFLSSSHSTDKYLVKWSADTGRYHGYVAYQ